MRKIFLILITFELIIFSAGIYFYFKGLEYSEKGIKIKGKNLINTLYSPIVNSIKFSTYIERTNLKELNLLMEAIREGEFNKEKLFELGFKFDLFEITIIDKNNKVIESTRYKKGEILKEEKIMKGKEEKIEEDTLYFLKNFGNFKILILKDLRGIKLLKREYGIKYLIEEISRDPEIDFFLFQAKEGIVFGTKLPENLTRIEDDEFLKNCLNTDSVCIREILNNGKKCLEFAKSVIIFGEKEGILRIGFSMDNYFLLLKNLRNFLLIFLSFFIILSLISFFALKILKREKEIKFYDRILKILKEYEKSPLIFVKENGEIIFANKKVEEILKEKNIINKNIFEIDKMDIFKIKKCKEEEREIFFEERINGKLFSGNTFSLKEGKNKFFFSILRDISEVFEKLKEEKFSDFSQFLAGLAHEIKNPLNLLSLSICEIEGKLEEDEFLKIKNAYKELKEKVEEFLIYLKPFDIERREINIYDLFKEIEEENKEILKKYRIDFKIEGKDLKIISDYKKLKKIFSNIIKNSIEAQEEGGIIEIKFEKINDKLRVEISDRGMGIPPEDIDKIFSPFYTKKEKGTGLGLFLVKKLLQDLNGEIKIESKYGFGTKVIIEF
jgi:signal transduction histidine kinase